MTSPIQFQSRVDWRWPKIGGFFLVGSIASLVFWGPWWAFGFSLAGLVVAFIGFIRSPLWPSVLLALFHALFLGIAFFLYVLFILPASDQSVPALTMKVTDPSGRMSVRLPAGWQATPILTEAEPAILLKPVNPENFLTFQEIKVQLRKTDSFSDAEPVLKTFTMKKFWFRFHQVTVMGYKGPGTLCSVSTVVLPPHQILAQDLCKAVFKNIEVPATIKP